MKGWIKLHRSLLDWEWFDYPDMVKLFVFILLSANSEDSKWRGVDINRGQFITGLNSLSGITKISNQKIRTCLSRLKNTGEINMQTTNKYTIITVCNYDSYQERQQTNNNKHNKQTTNKQQTNNNKQEEEEYKKKKKEENIVPEYQEFKDYAISKKKNVCLESLNLKYQSWVENGWKDGNDRKIKNWKSKLLNTLKYLENGKTKQNYTRGFKSNSTDEAIQATIDAIKSSSNP